MPTEEARVDEYDAEVDEAFICEGCEHEQDCTDMDGWVLHQQIALCLEKKERLYKPEADWINELYGTETVDVEARPSNEMMEHYKRGGRDMV
jgi:hypothetical protein